jgi:hypothetical protein
VEIAGVSFFMPDPGQDKPFTSTKFTGDRVGSMGSTQTPPNLSTPSTTPVSSSPPPLTSKPISDTSKPMAEKPDLAKAEPAITPVSTPLVGLGTKPGFGGASLPTTNQDKTVDVAKAQDEINKAVGGVPLKPPLPTSDTSKPMGGQPLPEQEKEKLKEKAKEMIKELDKKEDKLKQDDKTTTEMPPGGKPKSGKMKTYIGGLAALLLLVGGVTAGLFLTKTGQDIRQMAYPGGGCAVPGVCGPAGGCSEGEKCVRDVGTGDNYPYCRVDSECGGTGGNCTNLGKCGSASGGCSEGYKCVRGGDNYPYCSPDPTGCASTDSGTGGVCGDGTCDDNETTTSCPADCATTDSGTGECGDGVCDVGEETWCPADCTITPPGVCQDGTSSPDPNTWKICECPNGCHYKCDNSPGGGGGCGWVCDQSCREVPRGQTPSSDCWQIDYVKVGTGDYCGVAQIHCPPSCRGGDSGDSDSGDSDSGDSDSGQQALVCNSMSSTNAAPEIGDEVSFTCQARAQGLTIAKYEFRYSIDGGNYVGFSASGGGATSAFTVNQAGSYSVQCRACTADDTCTPWEVL